MHILDNANKIKKLDKSNMIGSIDVLPKQIEQAWDEVRQVKIPGSYKKINNIVINGMGGSGLGCDIIRSVFFKKLKLPLLNIHSYDLPGSVGKNTLYVISSYSGSTEEPISTLSEAKKRGAKILGITTGKILGDWIQKGKIPGYLFRPKFNPCNEPRMGIGYSVTGLVGLMNQCGVIKVGDGEMKKIVLFLSRYRKKARAAAKKIALEFKNKIPVIVVADFLEGNAHVLANQINENAKNFSSYYVISEMNHHLMEGLANPKMNGKNFKYLFIESDLYHKKNQTRVKITKDIVKKNKINYINYRLEGKTNLEQSFGMLLLGSYVSFYLAMLNGVDPSPILWVDYFKEQLK